MQPVHIVGLGMGPQDLKQRHLEIIKSAEILVGGRRHLSYFPDHPGEKIPIKGPLEDLFKRIKELCQKQQVVILSSGDPNFFGIAPRAAEALGPDNVIIHPNITAVQAACARLRIPWNSIQFASLHGRGWEGLQEGLSKGLPLAVYTDPSHTPSAIAGCLKDLGLEDLRLCVLENLGHKGEKVTWLSVREAKDAEFSDLNLLFIFPPERNVFPSRKAEATRLHLGMPDEAFSHRNGLITKSEIRIQALGRLSLGPGMTLWDVGAGCGSVGIEASLLVPGGRVIAVEKDRERAGHIKVNQERFGVYNLTVVQGTAPECLAGLPEPDRVFVGGGGRDLGKIIEAAARRLKKDGRIVVNAILLETLNTAVSTLEGIGFKVDIVQIQVARDTKLAGMRYFKAQNPVWVVTGTYRSGSRADLSFWKACS